MFLFVLFQLLVRGLYHFVELRLSYDQAIVQVCHEGRVDGRPVVVSDRGGGDKMAALRPASDDEVRQIRSKKEVLDPVRVVEVDDLRDYAEGRIIQYDRVRLVGVSLIIAARIERPDDPGPVEAVVVGHPVGDRLVYDLGRVALVGRLFRLEFLHELFVIVIDLREGHLGFGHKFCH